MDAIIPTLPALLHRIAVHRATAARLTAEIEAAQRHRDTFRARGMPRDEIDAIADTIMELRSRLMASDAARMMLVELARRQRAVACPTKDEHCPIC